MNDGHQTKSLKELVGRFLETSPFQKQLTAAMVRSAWHNRMPKAVCERTEKLYVQHNKIFLKITSAPLRHQLKFNKEKILMMFHEAIPNTLLEDVVFL